ncbi:MAG: hypothetical protein ACHQ53_16345 [Polyangiales bacterium]
MTHLDAHTSRTLTATLAAAPLALLVLCAVLFPGRASELTPLALMLPLLSMAGIEAAFERRPGKGALRRVEGQPSLRCAAIAA